MSVGAKGVVEGLAVKAGHRAMWALGDYPLVASTVISGLGALLVGAAGIAAGDRVLDVASGPGNAALAAARTGAHVVACDLTPELLEAGRQLAERRGLTLAWREADAEALPFGDEAFDKVISCVGVMFAPDHQASADELVRVCRPGGTIGLVNWTPDGFVGQMLAAAKPFGPPPPAGALPPPLWGVPDHLRQLFGARVTNLVVEHRSVTVDAFATPEAFAEFFTSNYGPLVAVCRAIAGDPSKTAALEGALAALARRYDRGMAGTVMDWEYVLVTATRR